MERPAICEQYSAIVKTVGVTCIELPKESVSKWDDRREDVGLFVEAQSIAFLMLIGRSHARTRKHLRTVVDLNEEIG